ncbi:MAG: glucose 1-dehydrogenase [Planctomycetia bacterium]|nr:glucose 1-dehydrogenase [Planctomycetia bacterium]
MDLRGQAAVVTGASSGVGAATALDLARRGCDVLVNYQRSREAAEEVVAAAQSHGVRAIAFAADVADDAACRAMIAVAAETFGRLDILVNSAGTTTFVTHADLERVTDADWDRILSVNLKGPFQCIRAAQPWLQSSPNGCVVNVASIAGIAGTGSSVPYAASKAALINMTISLARALAPKIRINAVAPGFIAGRWLEQGLGRAYEAIKQRCENTNPLRAVCTPEDVSAAILSLIAGSQLITGQTLVVDGGMTIADPLNRAMLGRGE